MLGLVCSRHFSCIVSFNLPRADCTLFSLLIWNLRLQCEGHTLRRSILMLSPHFMGKSTAYTSVPPHSQFLRRWSVRAGGPHTTDRDSGQPKDAPWDVSTLCLRKGKRTQDCIGSSLGTHPNAPDITSYFWKNVSLKGIIRFIQESTVFLHIETNWEGL